MTAWPQCQASCNVNKYCSLYGSQIKSGKTQDVTIYLTACTSGLYTSNTMKYINILALAFSVCLFSLEAQAQIGDCVAAQAEAYLDVGNVRARILNNGALFYRPVAGGGIYEVPKGGQVQAIFIANIMIAGLIDNQLHAAASRYQDQEFWPGPLDENGMPPADCSAYDRIWEITKADIETYLKDGTIAANLVAWPWHLGAPVVDGDGDPGNYNLEGGDLPELLGDQRLWWIMNDRGNVHESTESDPIGLEIHGSAFAFNHPFLGQSTFYRYKIINTRLDSFDEAYAGIFVDADLGDFGDDFVGADTLLDMGYVYNANNVDSHYGPAAPALGVVLLNTASAGDDARDNDMDGEIDEPGEQKGMTSLSCVELFDWTGCDLCEPRIIKENYYSCMQGKTGAGMEVYEGFAYPPEGEPTPFYYPGDPVEGAFWSALNYDGEGHAAYLGDRNFSVSSGPFTMNQQDTLILDIGIVWSKGTDNMDSIRQLRKDVSTVRNSADVIYAPVAVNVPENIDGSDGAVLGFDQNFPNPFSGVTSIRYSLPKAMRVRLAVYDILGREVELLVESEQSQGVYTVRFNGDIRPQGVYYARLELDHLQFTKRMVLVR